MYVSRNIYAVSFKMENSHVLKILQPNTSTQELTELEVIEGFEEPPEYVISNQWAWLLFIFLLICIVSNLAGKGYILWFVKNVALKRPLNTLITMDQVSLQINL